MDPIPSPSSRPAAPGRILVRGVNWLGDAVMSTPALLRLREAHPQAPITLLTPAKLADLFEAHPAVDAVMTFAPGESLWSIARRLRRAPFELGLILTNSPRSALELWLGRVPHRVGIARGLRNRLLTTAVPPLPETTPMIKRSPREIRARVANPSGYEHFSPPARAHQVHHYLHLAAAVGASPEPVPPFVPVSEAQLDSARARFGLAGSRWFGLNPGAEYGPAKRWPAERFAAVAVAAQRRWNCRWLILGGPGDLAVAETIAGQIARGLAPEPVSASKCTPLVLAGRTSLRELGAVLKICEVVLTNDTGPMHLAAAVGTPVVVPFGSTSPELTGPGLPGDTRHALLRVNAPCAPCFRRQCPIDFRCMLEIDTEMVLAGLAAQLGRNHSAQPRMDTA
jgi:heptosyltransferase-2